MKTPRKAKQWIDEIMRSEKEVVDIFHVFQDEDVMKFFERVINAAPQIAAANRGMNLVKFSHLFQDKIIDAVVNFKNPADSEDTMTCTLIFAKAYLEAHVVMNILSPKKVDEIIQFFYDNYEATK